MSEENIEGQGEDAKKVQIIGVRFETGGKVYYFDPKDIEFHVEDGVIVETAKGTEYGRVSIKNSRVDESEIRGELKPVIRKATEKDAERVKENLEKRSHAMKVFKEKIEKHKLDMKPVDAAYAFDRSKIVFYFTAEGRVDFRELVKDLAQELKTRIELRQIYERDDIKMRGAVASCGRPCCCITYLNDFEKVSIKMAKNQGLSLNSAKISGTCGKLMCCLKYENDYYQDVAKKMPKLKSRVKTPEGPGTVEGQNMLKQTVKVKVELPDGSFNYMDFELEKISRAEAENK